MALFSSWQGWALLSAAFAALTAIFGKIGVADIPADLATLIRTCVILVLLAAVVGVTGVWRPLSSIPGRSFLFLALSGAATGASWLCYYRALKLGPASGVAPVDKLSVVLVALFGLMFLGERLSLKNWLGIGLIAGGAVLVAARR
jgi:bacterial/archaeal transporter family protein